MSLAVEWHLVYVCTIDYDDDDHDDVHADPSRVGMMGIHDKKKAFMKF